MPIPTERTPENAATGFEPFRWHPSPTWFAHLWKAATQQHHREEQPLLARHLAADAVIVDVGAHAGQFSKLFSRIAPAGRIYAFEPGGYARSILRPALWLNRIRNVQVVPAALGEAPGFALLTLPIKRPGSYRFGLAHLGDEARWTRAVKEPIAILSLDQFAAATGLDRLDLIKADIEGWEGALIRGGRATIERLRPILYLELEESRLARAGDTLEGVWNMLVELRYRPYRVGADGALAPLTGPASGDVWWTPAERA